MPSQSGAPAAPAIRSPAPRPRRLFQTQVVGRRALQPIEIGVIQRQPPAAVLVDERERRAADVSGIDAEPLRQTAHERRLPCAKIARQQERRLRPAMRRRAMSRATAAVSSSETRDDDHDCWSPRVVAATSAGSAPRRAVAIRSRGDHRHLPFARFGQVAGHAVQEHRKPARGLGVEQLRQPGGNHAR